MSSAWDALPAIVPFFGAIGFTLLCSLSCMNRRMNGLARRVEILEQVRIVPASTPVPPPTTIPIPPIFPQQQTYSYPYYQPSAPPAVSRYV